ncbi:MAG: acyl carrier protein [Ruminococcaceae bacterium]|nr:acyl carrier protein [Oscillospiraceae bacterium]
MDELLAILQKIKPGVDFENETGLVEKRILDSMSIVRLVQAINDEFDIEITVSDLVPENFDSVSAMMALIERLEDEA